MGRTRSQVSRRLLAGVVAAVIAVPLSLAQPAPADPLNVSDIGVDAEVAQATLAEPGQVDITWQDEATILPGTGTLVRARLYNDGAIPQLDASLTIAGGGQLDPDFALDPACDAVQGLLSDTVVCDFGQLDPGESTQYVYAAIEAGTVSPIVTTATGSGTPDSVIPVEVVADDDETDSVTTNVVAQSGFAFLTDGESTSFASTSGNVHETFAVPSGATNGGGFFVHLYEGDSSLATCGGVACYQPQARADFVQVGGTTEPQPTNPLRMSVTYPNVKQTCNGLAYPGCNPIHYLPTGVTAGDAALVPACSSYTPNGTKAVASHDPCVYGVSASGNGARTWAIALIDDIGFPIPKISG